MPPIEVIGISINFRILCINFISGPSIVPSKSTEFINNSPIPCILKYSGNHLILCYATS